MNAMSIRRRIRHHEVLAFFALAYALCPAAIFTIGIVAVGGSRRPSRRPVARWPLWKADAVGPAQPEIATLPGPAAGTR